MADKALEDYLGDILNDIIPVIPKLADLGRLSALRRGVSKTLSRLSHSSFAQ